MWFDVVLIDKIYANAMLESFHIRCDDGESFAIDKLEDIDPSFRDVDVADVGSIRIYDYAKMKTTILRSRLRNFEIEPGSMLVQLEHFGVPVVSGYYAAIFPKAWRVAELNIYDPYHSADNIAEKRSYRGIDLLWDASSKLSCAQFNMESVRRGTFSIGLIASLRPFDVGDEWPGRHGDVGVEFTDDRHQRHPLERGYKSEVKEALEKAKSDTPMPGINVGLSGPSINIVEWGRYLRDKVRAPR